MTIQEIIEAIDQLSAAETVQIRAHLLERESTLRSEPVSDDLERMAGLFHSNVTDLSTNARNYLRDIFQNNDDRSH